MRRKHSDVMGRVVLALCEAVDSPRSLAVWLCWKYDQEELLKLPPTAIADNDTESFQLDYFITEYLSKYKGLKVSIDTRQVALDRWRSAEQQCAETNRRFRSLQQRPFSGRVETALFRAQRKIVAVLGRFDASKLLADCKMGPGATADLKGRYATPDNKISKPISVTAAALPYLRAVVQSDPHWSSCFLGVIPDGPFSFLPSSKWFSLIRGSRFLTVPKSAKTDRCIAAEPTGNMFLQQSVGSYLKRRLRRVGIRLDDQSINQEGARSAFTQNLSTLDLSAASDTISRELIYHLLPLEWATFLDSIRSPETQVDGSWVRTEKFASMGNSFCFELETLIFWALASSVVESHPNRSSVNGVLVYGDDIIVPDSSADQVVEILQVCGFSVNEDKSHIRGNFFESCGKHYHRGKDVTPVYQKEVLQHPSELIRAHNRLVRLSTRLPRGMLLVSKALRVCTESYPLRPFPRIPFGVDEDGGFLRPTSEFSLDKNHGYHCHVLDFAPRFAGTREDAVYAYKLRRFHKHSRSPKAGWLGDHSSNQPTNPLVTGHAGNPTEGRWRSKRRWIQEANVLTPGVGGAIFGFPGSD